MVENVVVSTRLLGFMVPLMVVSVTVVLLGSKSSNWLFASNYYPWGWSSVYPSLYGRHENSSSSFREFTPPAEGRGPSMELRRSVVGGGEGDEALSVDYTLQRSATPPLAIQVRKPELPGPSISRRFSNLQILEGKLQQARAAINDAQSGSGLFDPDYIPTGPIHWNPSVFHRSYLEMEKHFKVLSMEKENTRYFTMILVGHLFYGRKFHLQVGKFVLSDQRS